MNLCPEMDRSAALVTCELTLSYRQLASRNKGVLYHVLSAPVGSWLANLASQKWEVAYIRL